MREGQGLTGTRAKGRFCRLTRSLLVETGEGVADDVLWVGAVEPLPKHGEEHGEVDGTRSLRHHPLQVLIRRVLACEHTMASYVLVVGLFSQPGIELLTLRQ